MLGRIGLELHFPLLAHLLTSSLSNRVGSQKVRDVRVRRVNREILPVMRERLIHPARVTQRVREIEVGPHIGGINFQRPAVARRCLIHPARIIEDVAQVRMAPGVLGVNLHGPAVVLDRLVPQVLRSEGIP